MSIRTISRLLLVTFLSISCATFAQDIPFPNAGIDPSGSYAGKDVYQIDLSNGALSAKIPIVSYKEIGALQPISYFITVSNPVYTQQVTCDSDTDSCFMYYAAANQDINAYGAQLQMSTESAFLNAASHIVQTLTVPPYSEIYGEDNPLPVEIAYVSEMQYNAVDGTGHSHQMLHDPNNWNQMYAVDGTGFLYNAPSSDNTVDMTKTLWNSSWSPEGTFTESSGVSSILANTNDCDCYYGSTTIKDLSGNSYTNPAFSWSGTAPTITDSVQRSNLPVPMVTQVPPSASDVSHCPTTPAGALYSRSMTLPGYGTIWLCYTRVNYHTGLLTEIRPYTTLNFDGNGNLNVPDGNEWPMLEDVLETTLPIDQSGDNDLLEFQVNTVGSFDALQAVVLPDGRSWKFAYNTSVSSNYATGSSTYTCGGGVAAAQGEVFASTEACGGVTELDYPMEVRFSLCLHSFKQA